MLEEKKKYEIDIEELQVENSNFKREIADLKELVNKNKDILSYHKHTGDTGMRVNKIDISGFMDTVSSVPTYTPKNILKQFVFYKLDTTKRLYVYDKVAKAWSYVALT